MLWLLILPGLVCAYFIFLRPLLKTIPQFKQFYAEADGFWAKLWALSGRSLTVAWSYVLMGLGWLLQWLDPVASALGDPDFQSKVTSTLQSNPKILGYLLMAISALTIAARLRSIAKG